jgi:hypothetical protein
MRHAPEQPAPHILDDHDDVGNLFVPFDIERPRRVPPALAKAIAYKRDRCFVAEYPHLERRSWPKRKALRNQTWRRGVDAALRPALGEVGPEIDDFMPSLPKRQRSTTSSWRHANIPLGEWVHSKLEKRISFVGCNISIKLGRARNRRRLVPFLESLIAGRHGHAVELAQAFERFLDRRPLPRAWLTRDRLITDRSIGVDLAFWNAWCRALNALFAEQPEWEGRLRAWISEVAPVAPTQPEPAWKRIRRHRSKKTR